MSRRWTLIVASACAALAAAALLLSAATDRQPVRTFTMDAPNEFLVAILRPGTRVCEGPVTSDGPAHTIAVWGASLGGEARLRVEALAHGTPTVLASAGAMAGQAQGEVAAGLPRALPRARALDVCVADKQGVFALDGYPAVTPAVTMSGRLTGSQPGPEPGHEFSLVLLGAPDRSLLSDLPLGFDRASLWRPSWVGSWTFWVLAVALAAAFALGAGAVVRAGGEDAGGQVRNSQPERSL